MEFCCFKLSSLSLSLCLSLSLSLSLHFGLYMRSTVSKQCCLKRVETRSKRWTWFNMQDSQSSSQFL